MSAPIPSQTRFPTANQNPSNSILDAFNKQTYLGNQFNVVMPSVLVADTTEIPYLLLTNPSTSPKSLFINRRIFGCGDIAVANFYLNPTVITNGTAATITNARLLSGNTSNASCYLNPTVSANGTLFSQNVAIYDALFNQFMVILDPGASILVTMQAQTSGDQLFFEIGWYEL